MKTHRLIFSICLINFSLVIGIFGIVIRGKGVLVEGDKKTVMAAVMEVTPTEKPLVGANPVLFAQPTEEVRAEPLTDNRCVIVIDGISYDVTEFEKIHSGGDVFDCGLDVSAAFHGRHPDSYLEKMAKYRI